MSFRTLLLAAVLLAGTAAFAAKKEAKPPEPTPGLSWTMPVYAKEVKIYAVKPQANLEKPKRVHPSYRRRNVFKARDDANQFCNGGHTTPEEILRDCYISEANPKYDYIIKVWDNFGDPMPGYLCHHDKGWTCKTD